MRILLVPSIYVPLIGGVQISTHSLARELKSMGHNVVVLSSKWQDLSLPRYEIIDEIPVYRTLFYIFRGSLKSFIAFTICLPVALYQTISIFIRFKPEIINIHFIGANALYILLLRIFYKFPLIVTLHGNEPPNLITDLYENGYTHIEAKIMNWIAICILKKANVVTGVSHNLVANALRFVKNEPQKFTKISVGVDADKYKKGDQVLGRYILGLGRMAKEKGFDILIRSIKMLPKDFDYINLILAGDGPEMKNLKRLVEKTST